MLVQSVATIHLLIIIFVDFVERELLCSVFVLSYMHGH